MTRGDKRKPEWMLEDIQSNNVKKNKILHEAQEATR